MDIVTLGAAKSAIKKALTTTYKAGGSLAFANLPTLGADKLGYTYNLTDDFTTDSRFTDYDSETQTGHSYPAGTNVSVIVTGTAESPVYKFDVMGGIMDGYEEKSEVLTYAQYQAGVAGGTIDPNKSYYVPDAPADEFDDVLSDSSENAVQNKIVQAAISAKYNIEDIAEEYDSTATYIRGDIVIYNNVLYMCKISVTTPGAFNSDYWDSVVLSDVTDSSAKMSAVAPEFSPYKSYKWGDVVTYNGYTLIATSNNSPAVVPNIDWQNESKLTGGWQLFGNSERVIYCQSEDSIPRRYYPPGTIFIVDDAHVISGENARTETITSAFIKKLGPEWIVNGNTVGLTVTAYRTTKQIHTVTSCGFIFTLAGVEGISNCDDANTKLTVEKVNGSYVAAYPNTDIRVTGNTARYGSQVKAIAKSATSQPVYVRAYNAYIDENGIEQVVYSDADVYTWKG